MKIMKIDKNYLHLLEDIVEDARIIDTKENTKPKSKEKILIVDGLNLFLRNFVILNFVNESAEHIGGLGGFLRSLGVLIRQFEPTQVYLTFDGFGSTNSRKDIVPEYKSNRKIKKLMNVNIFNDVEEEQISQYWQVNRLIEYLQYLPVKVICLENAEADDIIAHLVKKLQDTNKIIIVSNDQDYLQLVNENVHVYKPNEKRTYDREKIIEKYEILPENFIIQKTLLGDNSDGLKGIHGLGKKGLIKHFPEIQHSEVSLKEIFKKSEECLDEHIIYSKIILNKRDLENKYKVMDLKELLLSKSQEQTIEDIIEETGLTLNIVEFVKLSNKDGIDRIIKNVDSWVKNNFIKLYTLNKARNGFK